MIQPAYSTSNLPVAERPSLLVPEQSRSEVGDLNSHQHQYRAEKNGQKWPMVEGALQPNGDSQDRHENQQTPHLQSSTGSGSEKGETKVQHGVTKGRAIQTTYVPPEHKFQ